MKHLLRGLALIAVVTFALAIFPASAQDGGTPKGLRDDAPTMPCPARLLAAMTAL